MGTHQDLLGGYEAGSLLIADSERMADCGPRVDRAERLLWRLRRAIAEAACRGAYCLYLALNDTHLTRWRCSCLVQFGDRKRPTNWWPARATDGTFTRAEAALRADPRRRLCGYSVCRTAEVLVRADQPGWTERASDGDGDGQGEQQQVGAAQTCTKLLGSIVPTVPLGTRSGLGELASSPSTCFRSGCTAAAGSSSARWCAGDGVALGVFWTYAAGTLVITPSSASRSPSCLPSWRGSLT